MVAKSPDELAAEQVYEQLETSGSLLVAMRLVIFVGQKDPDNPKVIEAAQEAIAAIKRMGESLGSLPRSN